MRLGIVVEGGGLRGAFAVGVLHELAGRLPEPPSHVFATSSGAPNAAYFVTGQIDDGVRIWEGFTHGRQLIDFANLVRPRPVMMVEELVSVFRDTVPLAADRLDTVATELHISVTDVVSGDNRVLRATPSNVFELMTAAMAVPFAYGKVVDVDGGRYIDGGFGAPVCIREAEALALDRIIVVLTKPAGHRRRPNPPIEWLMGRSFPSHPNAREAIRAKWHRYNATMDHLDTLEREGRALILRPPGELPAARLSRSKAKIVQSIELGRAMVRRRARAIEAHLEG